MRTTYRLNRCRQKIDYWIPIVTYPVIDDYNNMMLYNVSSISFALALHGTTAASALRRKPIHGEANVANIKAVYCDLVCLLVVQLCSLN